MDTTTLVNEISQRESRIDKSYFKTFSGIIKLTEIVLTVICLILVSSWYRFILCITLIVTLVCCCIYFFQLQKKIKKWALIEFYVTGTTAGLHVIGMATQFLLLHIVDGIFICVVSLVYAVGTYLLHREHKLQLPEVVGNNFSNTVRETQVFST